MSSSKLGDLMPSRPYALAYTLPLLLISVLLLFAGSFLILDRTRSFTPAKDVPDYSTLPGTFDLKKKTVTWLLEGGIGGLAIGYAFGVHLSTFLALLIPATTPSKALSPKAFLALWILACIPTTLLAGRFRLAALFFAGTAGGATLALGLALILHPALLPRQIFLGVFSALLTGLLLLCNCNPRLSPLLRPFLRTASASLGAFGLVVSIALLARPSVLGWANVWAHLWLSAGDPAEWGTNKEKGLSAAWAIFCVCGVAGDWGLSRWVGECPDEKWDSYLSKYMTDPPNCIDRAGKFRRVVSFGDRLFGKKWGLDGILGSQFESGEKDGKVFPDVKHQHHGVALSPGNLDLFYSVPPPKPTNLAFKLRSERTTSRTSLNGKKTRDGRQSRRKKPVIFGTIDELSSSGSSDEEGEDLKPKRLWVTTNQQPSYSSDLSSSTPIPIVPPPQKAGVVDVDYDKELQRLHLDQQYDKRPPPPVSWRPAFLHRHVTKEDLGETARRGCGDRVVTRRWDVFWSDVRVKAAGAG